MAATVATPLEKAFSGIAGVDEITSNSSLGSTNITLTFSFDRDIESAAQDVSAAISKTLPLLPPSILPPTAHKQNPASAPFLNLALTTNLLPLTELDEYAETTIAQRLSMVEGVATVLVNGSMKYAVRVRLDPARMATLGIGAAQVAALIGQNNVLLPTGVLYGKEKTLTVTASGQLSNAAGFSRLIVAYKNGAPVRLGDLGSVADDIQNDKSAAWYDDGKTAERRSSWQIFRQPGHEHDPGGEPREGGAGRDRARPAGIAARARPVRPLGVDQASVQDVKLSARRSRWCSWCGDLPVPAQLRRRR